MAEYWKSTPKYWCTNCSVYVRDTKLERANHEATAKHQNNVKRALREIHRGHEREEREKERAQREIDRLNGIVSGNGSSSTAANKNGGDASGAKTVAAPQGAQAIQAERKRQLEQLAELGVNIPSELRGDVAMAGEWTVTSTRVIEEKVEGDEEDGKEKEPDTSRAVGVKRALERTEEEKDAAEVEKAFENLRKKPRKWGRGPVVDEDLDALLSGSIVKKPKEEEIKEEVKAEVKAEDGIDTEGGQGAAEGKATEPDVKHEDSGEPGLATVPPPESQPVTAGLPVFKKRKGKK